MDQTMSLYCDKSYPYKVHLVLSHNNSFPYSCFYLSPLVTIGLSSILNNLLMETSNGHLLTRPNHLSGDSTPSFR